MGAPSTAHLIDFLAVLDHGGLSSAARALGKAQAAVSYSIQSLERDLGVTLFDRLSRPLTPTHEGLALASIARDVVHDVARLHIKSEGLRRGLESTLELVADSMLQMDWHLPFVKSFAERFPTVELSVTVEPLTSTVKAVLNGTSMIGIFGPMALEARGLVTVPLTTVKRLPVVAPSHVLAGLDGPISLDAVRRHTQILLLDRDQDSARRDIGVVASQCWRTSDLAAKREMLLAGLGWGGMPLHLIEQDLASGRLVPLPMSAEAGGRWATPLQLYLTRAKDAPLGPAASWLFRTLAEIGRSEQN